MHNTNPFSDYIEILSRFDGEDRLRHIPADRSDSPAFDLCSNDYMALSLRWKDFLDTFSQSMCDAPFSSSASRLLSQRQYHAGSLENLLSALYRKDCLLFNSGYHANVGIIQALSIPDTIFLCDKLIHASMIDGLRVSDADFARWKHNDIPSLRKLLEKNRDKRRCIVVVESIYSMDGDIAPLQEIVAMKNDFPNLILYVDEAHAFGARGDKGLGIAEEEGLIDEIDILVGTLGKAAASAGAFVATHPLLKDLFVNSSRSFIFSTALPPVNAAWSELMIRHLLTCKNRREHLLNISGIFRKGIEEITGSPSPSRSHIVPLITGDARKAIHLAARLSTRGIDALPIRKPTVPAGSERIRFSLSADLSESDVHKILEIIREEYED